MLDTDVKGGMFMKGAKEKEIILTIENKAGILEEISRVIKDNGINIKSMAAWVIDDKAFFRLIASDNVKTKEVLQGLGKIEEKEIVVVYLPDEVGQLFLLVSRLKESDIDLDYIHGTTTEPTRSAMVVFSSNDNDKALEVISG